MKSFQQIAPTIFSWLKFKRFRQIRRGWLRLLIVIYGVAVLGIFIASANCAPKYCIELENIGSIILWLYWPGVRIWLWIYDGFQHDKQANQQSIDIKPKNGAEIVGEKKKPNE